MVPSSVQGGLFLQKVARPSRVLWPVLSYLLCATALTNTVCLQWGEVVPWWLVLGPHIQSSVLLAVAVPVEDM